MGVLKEVISTYIEEDGKIKITEKPLVRCGECKYIYTDEGTTLCGVWGKYAFKDGFCYQGERRTDERIR